MRRILPITLLLIIVTFISCEKNESSNQNPTVEIISPEAGSSYEQGQIVTIITEASDPEGDLYKVKFFINDFLIFEDTEPPYRYAWSTVAAQAGNYVIKAEAVDREPLSAVDQVTVEIYTQIDTKPMELILVEGGDFQMGCIQSANYDCFSSELPIHNVYIDSFYMSKHEVTNYQFAQYLNETGVDSTGIFDGDVLIDMQSDNVQIVYKNQEFSPENGKENFPVVEVSWLGAKMFCEHGGGRLPTEAEWEFAARGGKYSDSTIFAGSSFIDEVAWYIDNAGNRTHEVGTKIPNEIGLHDMSGNVWEWCNDWYDEDYYETSPFENPTGPASGVDKVLRGGIWNGSPEYCRVSYRDFSNPVITNNANGFRFVKDAN